MSKLKKVLIMAGGTGGHVFPGLAVARRMRDEGIDVHWLGTQAGLEARVVPEADIPIHYISIGGVRGKSIKQKMMAPFRLLNAVMQALKIIRQINPDIVIGMGGFASGPGGIASWLLRKPIVIHEQNAKAGMTNTWLACVAKKVLEGFPKTFKPSKKVIAIGNPVRSEIANLPAPEKRIEKQAKPLHLLVLGGSLGAQAINELLPQALAILPEHERPFILHQVGEKHFENAKMAYDAAGIPFKEKSQFAQPFSSQKEKVEIVPFIQEMDKAYCAADLVLCRAGALTIAELCAAGLGAILVPFPFAVDDHQTVNGNFMVEQGAAILVQQKELTAEKLAALLKEFYFSREKCIAMAKAAYSLRRVDATNKVLTICQEICGELDI
jgi:UDP-N-acetylglucosamine--N-acetylmuramyl-(pentapeptide) pyrophosphoryl-undecaprenol N-acetylglucosamine transferase